MRLRTIQFPLYLEIETCQSSLAVAGGGGAFRVAPRQRSHSGGELQYRAVLLPIARRESTHSGPSTGDKGKEEWECLGEYLDLYEHSWYD